MYFLNNYIKIILTWNKKIKIAINYLDQIKSLQHDASTFLKFQKQSRKFLVNWYRRKRRETQQHGGSDATFTL